MTYDDSVRRAMYETTCEYMAAVATEDEWMGAPSYVADRNADAIPPLTLKTEDGRFVKVEPLIVELSEWPHEPLGRTKVYRIVEDPTQ